MTIEGANDGLPPLPNGERVAGAKRRSGEGAAPTDPTKRKVGATARARKLRVDETEAEYRLWGELRDRHLNGYKFVRQVPLGPFIADFVCREVSLIVELDGSQHADSPTDPSRTAWLNGQGYSVLRFWNHEVLAERRAVLDTILACLDGKIATPSPDLRFAPATLSPLGRGGRQSAEAR
ncbi:endonuclease domain-containing protein [Mesorhizobium sp. M7A.F.Ca.US.006.04.2.1]|nr:MULTISPECIES: endonuclease domain-containing protein [unclassified Mesorhizobium]RUX72420.1 endonuclease domain-containing protein [Mesorhizobium sp. M7A.F.Ca.US.005.03.1.1]RUY16973.1 endonuclease domain-containing protein [Mesorhizobium sp. M7A.F.Ca.US.005.03.2.1]RUY21980.1 endonuclease domain-containing protein [Mesorhizobium sp. M7A.F.Ca.US.001.04.2.1]RUY34272.1 endonuclease domain-containing protein [Mesorhizobium sp. M7A.F.Ca.US.001.04.1.1]RVA00319.1 endonuclease domain-containing prot